MLVSFREKIYEDQKRLNMKIYSLVILLTAASLLGCSKKEEKFPGYQFNAHSVICIEVPSIEDTIEVEANYFSRFNRENHQRPQISTTIFNEGEYCLTFQVEKPASVDVTLNEERNHFFIYPKDTLHVLLEKENEDFNFHFKGRTAPINEYLQAKALHLGYKDIRIPLNQGISNSSTLSYIAERTDSITNAALIFLDEYTQEHSLPDWFIETEKANITYTGAAFKLGRPNFLSRFSTSDEKPPAEYYSFLKDIPINNPNAVLSDFYLYFLDSYFLMNYDSKIWENLNGYKRHKTIHSLMIPQALDALSGKPLDVFLAQKIYSEFVYTTNLNETDSLLLSVEDRFTSDAFPQFLKDYRSSISVEEVMERGKTYQRRKLSKLKKGDKAPYFYLVDTAGKPHELSEYKGQVIYMNFWASWCGPCIKSIPEKNELAETLKDQPVVFINVNIDQEKEVWLKALKKHEISGVHLFPEGNWSQKIREDYRVSAIPHYVLIDQKGNIAENFTEGPHTIEDKLFELVETN